MPEKLFQHAYLHIGLGKTGSSHIQSELLANADWLHSEHDLLYPWPMGTGRASDGNHSPLITALCEGGKINADVSSRLEGEFRQQSASRLLLSAECVGHLVDGELNCLAQWLHPLAEQITVIACLRHPASALSSEIQQLLRLGHTLEDLYQDPPYYPLRDLIERVQRAFAGGTVLVYDFARARENPRGLTATLLDNIGIHAPLPRRMDEPVNPSMSHEAALLLSAINSQQPIGKQGGKKPWRAPGDIHLYMSIPGRKFRAPPEVYAALTLTVQPHLAWLHTEHGLDLGEVQDEPAEEYLHFSRESIDDIALKLGFLAKEQYATSSPARYLMRLLRLTRHQLFSLFKNQDDQG